MLINDTSMTTSKKKNALRGHSEAGQSLIQQPTIIRQFEKDFGSYLDPGY